MSRIPKATADSRWWGGKQSTTGHCFCFGSASSFLLELYLHSSPVAYWTPTDLGISSFSVISFAFAFSYYSWGSQGNKAEIVCHSLLQWTHLSIKKGWMPKNWCLWTMVLKKTLESPLDSKDIKPVNYKENQHWISIGRTDAEAEAPVFGHLMQRANSLEKTLMLGNSEGRRRRGWWGWLDSIIDSMDMSLRKHQEMVKNREPGMLQSMGVAKRRMTDWTTINNIMTLFPWLCMYYLV